MKALRRQIEIILKYSVAAGALEIVGQMKKGGKLEKRIQDDACVATAQ